MVSNTQQFLHYIQNNGVGRKDKVASSPKKYIRTLHIIADLLQVNIAPSTLRCEADIARFDQLLVNLRHKSTRGDYRAVMRAYIKMVAANGL